MKFEIKHKITGSVLFTAEIEADENSSFGFKLGLAVKMAVKSSANLSYADLRYADLSYADLSSADLSSADLSSADLSSANLSSANLRSANLRYANLRYADLRYANLRYANLSYANLSSVKNDYWAVLLTSIREIPFLRAAIAEGKIDGSVYSGECTCLIGTIAHARGVNYKLLGNLKPDVDRPIESFFMNIKPGDTPEKSAVAKLVLDWTDEFTALLKSNEVVK